MDFQCSLWSVQHRNNAFFDPIALGGELNGIVHLFFGGILFKQDQYSH